MSEEKVVQRGYRIKGRVQGVFFRSWTREAAVELGLAGTVENCPDGSVEAHLIGPKLAVERMAARFWEGPPASRVEKVEMVESVKTLNPRAFEILH